MKAFGQMDYLGDTCIRLLAMEYKPHNPHKWAMRFGKNSFLAQIYIAVAGSAPPTKLPHTPKGEKIEHLRASHVEAWLGTAYESGGIDAVKMYWQRLIKLWVTDQRKTVENHKRGLIITAGKAGVSV